MRREPRPRNMSEAQIVDWFMETAVEQPKLPGPEYKDLPGNCVIPDLEIDDNGYRVVQSVPRADGSKSCTRFHKLRYAVVNGISVWSKELDGWVIGHDCDVPSCCQITHLKKISHSQNMADMKRRGRSKARLDRYDGRRKGAGGIMAKREINALFHKIVLSTLGLPVNHGIETPCGDSDSVDELLSPSGT